MCTYFNLLTNENAPVVYIDEKFVYTTNRPREINKLPIGHRESAGADFTPTPKIRSRRFPIKAMFMGVVARPQPHRNFDGKIFLRRVSTQKKLKRNVTNQNFTHDAMINSHLKKGGWKELYPDNSDMSLSELVDIIGEMYGLEDGIVCHTVFTYPTYVGNDGNTKIVTLELDVDWQSRFIRVDKDKSVPSRQLKIEDLTMKVALKKGDNVEVDCTCDSEFMLKVMDEVGQNIRAKFKWVSEDDLCYLVMDNAGGHGTNEAIKKYSAYLLSKYKIKIIFQVPRSPFTNVLDLGVWMSLQAMIEKSHHMRRCEVGALVHSVNDTWENGKLDGSITNVFNRIHKVLCLVVEG